MERVPSSSRGSGGGKRKRKASPPPEGAYIDLDELLDECQETTKEISSKEMPGAPSGSPKLDLRQLPPPPKRIDKAKLEDTETSLPIISSPLPTGPPQDAPAVPVDPLLLASSIASYFPTTFKKWNNLSIVEAEDRLLMNVSRNAIACASLVRKIRQSREETVPAIPRPVLEVEADIYKLQGKVERLEKDTKRMKGKIDRTKAAKDEAEKKAKDAMELFKNSEEDRKFALEFAAANNADVLSYLMDDPDRQKRFLDLFETSEVGSLYKYRVQTRGAYTGQRDEQEKMYRILRQKLGEGGVEKLKARLELSEPYDPIPPPHESIFPPDPDAKRDDKDDEEEEAEDPHGREDGGGGGRGGGSAATAEAEGSEAWNEDSVSLLEIVTALLRPG